VEYSPGENDRDIHPGDAALGIFDRVNNYLLLLYALACFFMYFSIMGLLILSEHHILSLIVPGIIAFIIPMILLSRRFSLSFREEYRVEMPDLTTTALVLIIAAGTILPVDAILSFVKRRYPPDADYISFLLSFKPKGILALITTGIGLVIVTPFGEELLFRGFVQRIFQRNMQRYLAVMLASIIFGLCHFSLIHLPALIPLGMLLGYLFYRTGNIIYPVIVHAGYNLVSLWRLYELPDTAPEVAEIEYPSIPWTIASIVAIALCIRLIERRRSGSAPQPDG
jgi:membrane protease YdiL (CAAX protease family)